MNPDRMKRLALGTGRASGCQPDFSCDCEDDRTPCFLLDDRETGLLFIQVFIIPLQVIRSYLTAYVLCFELKEWTKERLQAKFPSRDIEPWESSVQIFVFGPI